MHNERNNRKASPKLPKGMMETVIGRVTNENGRFEVIEVTNDETGETYGWTVTHNMMVINSDFTKAEDAKSYARFLIKKYAIEAMFKS